MSSTVDILEVKGNTIIVLLRGFSVAYANALRRLVLSDVPTMTVDFAYIYDNTTDIYDEMIAHRLGLVVFKSDVALEKYAPPEVCAELEPPNPKCFVEIFLDVSVDEKGGGVYVKASDLSISDEEVEPVYPGTPIAFVAPGQRLHIVAYARLGRGREHAKWSPASVSILKYTPIVYYDSSKATGDCLECVSAYPDVVKALSSGGSGKIELYGLVNTSGLRYCAETACRECLRIVYDSSSLQLIVEGTGALRPERIILEASRVLEDKVKTLKSHIASLGVSGK
ncbi:MAG: DNA-directed RNA polymerase subunit D [Thermoprotei archaeon]|nr:DNA-directed RNA polymerase subunit D [Thermoprotei archaeon]